MSTTEQVLEALGILVIERSGVWDPEDRQSATYVFRGKVLVLESDLDDRQREHCLDRAIQYECQGGSETWRQIRADRAERGTP